MVNVTFTIALIDFLQIFTFTASPHCEKCEGVASLKG